MSEDETRARIVREALSWVGTPFHDCAGVKGAGVDCAYLVQRVYVAVGVVEDFSIEPYPPQWFLHRDQPRFLRVLSRYAHPVPTGRVGDVAMFRYGRQASHAAILIDEHTIVHAFMPAGRVTRDDLSIYLPRLDSYWSAFP